MSGWGGIDIVMVDFIWWNSGFFFFFKGDGIVCCVLFL